ncbi:ThiF family adenylyltransferase [Terribacillus saccharophilus]|uniref:ThiF family adenylyltransferase n=1 Tax=Terribacillus saccharophilus TaxID=361277 RepID=UPI003D2B45CE
MKEIRLLKDFGRYDTVYPFICQIGTGATGTNLVQNIAQMLSGFRMSFNYILADPDVVEDKNLKNQLFISKDVGQTKAKVLAKRYSAAYDIGISSYSDGYVEDVKTLKRLFSINEKYADINYGTLILPILIGSVDNNFTRKVMHEFFYSVPRLLYIDVGNDSVKLPKDKDLSNIGHWTADEKTEYDSSGWDGQVVCGLRFNNETILEPVATIFPNILEEEDEIAPSEVSCSNVVASDPQRLMTNRMASISVLTYLNQIFESGTINNHMTFFHAKDGFMRSQ